MKTKTLILIALALLSYGSSIKAQEQDSIAHKTKLRTVFLTFLGAGYPEFFTLRLGWQINDEWSVAVKGSIYDSQDSFLGLPLIGLQTVKHFPNSKIVLNNISVTSSYYHDNDDEYFLLEAYTGWEGVYRYVRPYWAIGFTYLSEIYRNGKWDTVNMRQADEKYRYFYPGIKVGLNLNL